MLMASFSVTLVKIGYIVSHKIQHIPSLISIIWTDDTNLQLSRSEKIKILHINMSCHRKHNKGRKFHPNQ